jgi:peroxiredoxin
LSGLDGWLQSPPRSLSQHRGRVVLVWFFSLSAPGCVEMVPALRSLWEDHRGLVDVIGVHAPQFADDADPQRIALGVARAGMPWPVAMDHRRTVFTRWHADRARQGWPSTHVVDQQGRVVAIHDGAGVDPIRTTVEALLDR